MEWSGSDLSHIQTARPPWGNVFKMCRIELRHTTGYDSSDNHAKPDTTEKVGLDGVE
jgi:hypothetical protein